MDEYRQLAGEHSSADYLTVYNGKLTEVILPSFGADFLIRVDGGFGRFLAGDKSGPGRGGEIHAGAYGQVGTGRNVHRRQRV